MSHSFAPPFPATRSFRKRRRPLPSARPRLELLEDRRVPASIFVHTFTDGPSQAILPGGIAPNLRSAVDNSAVNDEIVLDNGVYTLAGGEGFGELKVQHPLLIHSAAGAVATIDGRHHTRMFEVSGDESLTLTGLVLTGGTGSGTGQGGGLFVDAGAGLTLNNDWVDHNSATGVPAQGGAIYNLGTLTVNNSIISRNQATGSTAAVQAVAQGGGIYSGGGTVTLSTSTLVDNVAFGGSGAQGIGAGYDGSGGGLFLANTLHPATLAPAAVISNSMLANNSADGGNGTQASGNARGGGLFQDGNTGAVSITASAVFGNNAVGGASFGGQGDGGGLFQNTGAGDLSVLDSTFANNTAQGGYWFEGPGGNAAGGGLWLGGSGTDRLVNDSVAWNAAYGGPGFSVPGYGTGGGLSVPAGSASPQVWNMLIAGNAGSSGFKGPAIASDVEGAFASVGHNLVGTTAAATGFSAAKGDLLNVPVAQLVLGGLTDNGGPSPSLGLQPGSMALDQGDDAVLTSPTTPLTTDQRGQPRRLGPHVDIGACERLPLAPAYSVRSDQVLQTTPANGLLAYSGVPPGSTVRLVPGSLSAGTMLVFHADGSFAYQPPRHFGGTVYFLCQLVSGRAVLETYWATVTVQQVP